MKLLRILVLVILGILIFAGVSHRYEKRAQTKRDASYQAALSRYSQLFQSGASRKTVEDYFRSRGVGILQQSRSDSPHSVSDLILIGRNPAPFYCSSRPVFVEFDFATRPTANELKPDGSDPLKRVRLESRSEGACSFRDIRPIR